MTTNGAPGNQFLIKGLLLLTMFIWGSAFVAIKIGLEELSVTALTLLRFGVAALVFLPFVRLPLNRPLTEIAADVGRFFLVGAFGIFAYHVFLNLAESLTTATVASILGTLAPAFTALLAYLLLKERFGLRHIAGSLIALVGSLLVVLGSTEGIGSLTLTNLAGPLLALIPPVAWAAYSVAAKPLLERYSSWQVTVNGTVAGTVLMLPFAFVGDFAGEVANLSLTGWLIILYLAFGATNAGYIMWNYALSHWTASRTSVWTYLMPLFTALIAVPLLGEPLTVPLLIGAALIIVGVNLVEREVRV